MDISFSDVLLENPVLENDKYVFKIKYRDSNKICLESKHTYYSKLNEKNEIVQRELGITNKEDLGFLHKVQQFLYEQFYNRHDEWFENKFTKQQYKALFENYLHPNIEENCVNITLRNVVEASDDTYEMKMIIPKICIDSIVYENETIYINVFIEDFSIKEKKEETQEVVVQNETDKCSEKHVEHMNNEENIEKNVLFSKTPETIEQEEENINETKNEEVTQNEAPLEEVVFDQSNMDETTLSLNDEDLYIIYKIINTNIKENLSESILKIMEEKNVKNIENINLNDIIYDSDEEESDEEDDFLDNDEFEEEYKKLM
jgi:hypothetical protein